MNKVILTLAALILSSQAMASDKVLSCIDTASGEPVIAASSKDHSITFSFQRSGKTEKSSVDIFAAKDSLALISNQVDRDGEDLIQSQCPEAKPQFQTILVVNDKLAKRFCLSCVELNTSAQVK